MRVLLRYHLAKFHFFYIHPRVLSTDQPAQAGKMLCLVLSLTILGGADIVCWGAGGEQQQSGVVWLVCMARDRKL